MTNPIETSQELTAKQIFKQLLSGLVVKIPPDESLANQLKNHLNVIKSREKKLFLSLGLDFTSSIISVKFIDAVILTEAKLIIAPYYSITLMAPKVRRKYTVFSIQQQEAPQDEPIPSG